MTLSAARKLAPVRHAARGFDAERDRLNTLLINLYSSSLRHRIAKLVSSGGKTHLDSVWDELRTQLVDKPTTIKSVREPLEVHRALVEGLPGEALYLSAAMTGHSLAEALPLFDVTLKTARQRVGDKLTPSESEMALRIGRVLAMAGEVLGSYDAAREYLQTDNLALGGQAPRELLRTAEGEQLVLAELQTQAEGGPV